MSNDKFIDYATAALSGSGISLLGLILKDVIKTDLAIRKEEWIKLLGEAFEDLHKKGHLSSVEDIKEEKSFTDIFIAASKYALATSIEKKRNALRNTILNASIDNIPDLDKSSIFLQDLNTFTEWHIIILEFINNPRQWYTENDLEEPISNSIFSIRQVISKALPKLIEKK